MMWDEFVRCVKPEGKSALHNTVWHKDLCSVLSKSMQSTGHCASKTQLKCWETAFEAVTYSVHSYSSYGISLWKQTKIYLHLKGKKKKAKLENIYVYVISSGKHLKGFVLLSSSSEELFAEAS